MSSVTTTITMSAVIDQVLDQLHRATARPRQCVLAVAAATNDTTITVDAASAANLAPTDLLEFGREVMLVTAKSGATITVSRGYLATQAAAHPINTRGVVNPDYPRYTIDRAVRRCFTNSLDKDLPCIVSEVLYPDGGLGSTMRPLDAEAIMVHDVRHQNHDGRVTPLRGYWDLEDWLPDEVSYTAKALKVPHGYSQEPLIVTYSKPYTWTGSGEAATISVPVLGGDLPYLYAVATLQTGVELSRNEFDQIEEWPAQTRNQRGVDIRLLQTLWGQFFQQLDAAMGIQNVPVRRPFRGTARRL
jgi:hypothetical protein